jgi:hypothetical protein
MPNVVCQHTCATKRLGVLGFRWGRVLNAGINIAISKVRLFFYCLKFIFLLYPGSNVIAKT